MQEHIFTKLDMHGSYILDENAQYHSDTAFNKAQSPLIYGIEFYASGTASQVSTAYDLGKFFNALLSEQILQPESLELMLTAHADVGGSYGYGIGHLNGSLNVYSHTGLNDGFRSIFVINKEKNAVIVILGNGGDNLPDFMYLIDLAGEFIQ